MKNLAQSFVYAFKGITYCLAHERNMRIHLCFTLFMFGFLTVHDFFEVTKTQFALLFAVCSSVLALECVNTAIEKSVDLSTKEINPVAAIAKDTAAIQSAIDAASAAGGGTVVIPPGTYLSGTVFLKSDVKIEFEKGAVLKASPDKGDYCGPDAFAQNYACDYDNTSGGHLIVAADCTNIAITGPGRIDGNSAAFLTDDKGRQYDNWKKGIPWRPGQMLYIVDCRNVVIEGMEMVNSPYWTCLLFNCEKVTVQDCVIRTERKKYRTWNGDGIDIDRCRDVFVTRCDIDTEDDAITLRASMGGKVRFAQECRNVKVERCRLSSNCNAIRVGVGEGVIRDCHLSQIDVHNTATAVNIISSYTPSSRGTDIRDVTFASVQGECDRFLSLGYGRKKGDALDAVIENITFQDVRVKVRKENDIREESSRPFGNIIFDDGATR